MERQQARRTRSRRVQRKAISYRETTSAENSEQSDSQTVHNNAKKRLRSSQRSARPDYTETNHLSSDDTNSEVEFGQGEELNTSQQNEGGQEVEDNDDQQNEEEYQHRPVGVIRAKPRKRRIPSKCFAPNRIPHRFSTYRAAKRVKREHKPLNQTRADAGKTSNLINISPWQNLEHEILVQILKSATYPLLDGVLRPKASLQWLLDVSRLSKSFHAAAMAALLYSPPMRTLAHAQNLLHLLNQEPSTLSINYRTKIRRLEIEVNRLVDRKHGLNLEELVKSTPLLTALQIYHHHDRIAPAAARASSQPQSSSKTWSYPEALFDALDESHIVLREFEFNARFPNSKHILARLSKTHQRSCMQCLQALTLLNLTLPDKAPATERAYYAELLLGGLKQLPKLESLTLVNSNFLDELILSKIPDGLRSLTFVNCAGLTSQALQSFLQPHGTELRELILESNQSLDLGFVPDLAQNLPNLEVLKIDLTYYDPTPYHDTEPHYDNLLPNGQPSWPKKLRSIDISNLRNLDGYQADAFFETLIEAAPELPDLRSLSLKAILKVGWRERATLRLKWTERFKEIFLRRSTNSSERRRKISPTPFYRSALPLPSNALILEKALAKSPDARKSARNSQRLSTLAHEVYSSKLKQQLCTVVVFRMDDQRPSEAQFHEGDFLDSELSGDDDYSAR